MPALPIDSLELEQQRFDVFIRKNPMARSVFRALCEAGATSMSGREILKRALPKAAWPAHARSVESALRSLRRQLAEFNVYRKSGEPRFWTFELPTGSAETGIRLIVRRATPAGSQRFAGPRERSSSSWKPFSWRSAGRRQPDIPIHVWLPDNRQDDVALLFEVSGVSWQAPPGFKGYADYRARRFKSVREQSSQCYDGHVWSVSGVAKLDERRIRLDVQPCKYADFFATNLSLETNVLMDSGIEEPILSWVAPQQRGKHVQYVLPAANPLAVNVLVVTRDNWVVLVEQSSTHPVSPKKWVASASGTVELDLDHDTDQSDCIQPGPLRTAVNEVYEEIGINIRRQRVHWVGFGVGLRMCTPCVLGEVTLNEDRATVAEMFAERKDRLETSRLDFVRLRAPDIVSAVNDPRFPHGSYFTLGLALCLVRRGKASIPSPSECV